MSRAFRAFAEANDIVSPWALEEAALSANTARLSWANFEVVDDTDWEFRDADNFEQEPEDHER